MELNVSNMLNLSSIVIESLKNRSLYSRYVSIYMSENNFWSLSMPTDLCLREIAIYDKDKILKFESPAISLVEMIEEFYNISTESIIGEIYTEHFAEKLLNLMKDKTPELYKGYMADIELINDLSAKYNVNLEKILDPGGNTYITLKSSIRDKDMKGVANIIKEGLKAFEEYCTRKKGKLFQNVIMDLEDPLEQIDKWLVLIKNIYLNNKQYNYPYIELSNTHDNPYKAPYIRFTIENKREINSIIILQNKFYILSILTKEERFDEHLVKAIKADNFKISIEGSQLKFERKFAQLHDIISWLNKALPNILL